jgi:hypothetical protein
MRESGFVAPSQAWSRLSDEPMPKRTESTFVDDWTFSRIVFGAESIELEKGNVNETIFMPGKKSGETVGKGLVGGCNVPRS